MESENQRKFLSELTELSKKYNLQISGCGCLGSPYISEIDSFSEETKNLFNEFGIEFGYTTDDNGSYLTFQILKPIHLTMDEIKNICIKLKSADNHTQQIDNFQYWYDLQQMYPELEEL